MKKKNNIILILTILCLDLNVYCKTLNNLFFTQTYNLYQQSRTELKKQNFDQAISILEKIKKNNISSINNDKVQINLIYAYYKNLNFNMAQKNIQEFIQSYPYHPNIDYVLYIQCLINIDLDKNKFLKILPIEYHKNDPNHAINAFFQLKYFINTYPKSLYVINAKKNLIDLKIRLSEHDLKILQFYFIHKKYVAVINRGEEILQKYSETPAARKALLYIEKSFFKLKIFDTSKKISELIRLNKI